MTHDQFVESFCRESEMTGEFFEENFVALPCLCGEEECKGWAAIHRDPVSILGHLGSDLLHQYMQLRVKAKDISETDPSWRDPPFQF